MVNIPIRKTLGKLFGSNTTSYMRKPSVSSIKAKIPPKSSPTGTAGDSGKFGPAMKNVPNSLNKLTGIERARFVGGNAYAKGQVTESNANPQEKVYGGGGTKGIQAVGGTTRSANTPIKAANSLQGSRPNLQGNNPGPRAADSFYLSMMKKFRRTSNGYMRK